MVNDKVVNFIHKYKFELTDADILLVTDKWIISNDNTMLSLNQEWPAVSRRWSRRRAVACACRMPSLSILELVDLALVADTEVRDVCGRMPELRPGMADHIIALKRCAGHNLAKFGEKIPGGFLGKMLA